MLVWEKRLNEGVPDRIDVLVFVDSAPFLSIFRKAIKNKNLVLYGRLNAGVDVYCLEDNTYVVLSNLAEGYTAGEVVEEFGEFINKAKLIYCLTSLPLSSYINPEAIGTECCLRSLNFQQDDGLLIPKLENPNLVAGIGAAVLSFCVHNRRSCCLYVAYIDRVTIDSRTLSPLLELLRQINVLDVNASDVSAGSLSSNLYM